MAHIGHYISGAGHAGLIGFVLVGPLFSSEPLPFETVNVALVSPQDFAAMTTRPREAALPDAPLSPEVPDAAPERPGAEAPPTPPRVEQDAPPAPEPDAAVPEPPAPPAPVETPQTETPRLVAPEPVEVPDAPERAEEPRQRQVDRVAPEPVAPPEPDATIAEETREAVRPEPGDPTAETPREAQEATSEEAAGREIVTEAEEGPPAAPERSIRPALRPERFAARAPEPEPDAPASQAEPEDPPAPAPAPEPPNTASAVEDALRQALGGGAPAPDVDAPTGPPLTAGEREGLVLAVQECWVVDPGSPASEVVVTVGVSLTAEGRVAGDVRRLSATGGDARAQEVAFQSARRAVLRCQAGGFPLPPEKYAQWREVEITFNPESMRVR